MGNTKQHPAQYLLFAGPWYYPSQGWGDFVRSSNDFTVLVEFAQKYCRDERSSADWAHIVKAETEEVVWEWTNGIYG